MQQFLQHNASRNASKNAVGRNTVSKHRFDPPIENASNMVSNLCKFLKTVQCKVMPRWSYICEFLFLAKNINGTYIAPLPKQYWTILANAILKGRLFLYEKVGKSRHIFQHHVSRDPSLHSLAVLFRYRHWSSFTNHHIAGYRISEPNKVSPYCFSKCERQKSLSDWPTLLKNLEYYFHEFWVFCWILQEFQIKMFSFLRCLAKNNIKDDFIVAKVKFLLPILAQTLTCPTLPELLSFFLDFWFFALEFFSKLLVWTNRTNGTKRTAPQDRT